MDGLSIPGTIMFPAGRTATLSWTFLMASNVSVVEKSVSDLVSLETSYERLSDVDGFEEVFLIERANGALAIDEGSATDSLRTLLSWSGIERTTDSESWIRLTDGMFRPFELFRDDGESAARRPVGQLERRAKLSAGRRCNGKSGTGLLE